VCIFFVTSDLCGRNSEKAETERRPESHDVAVLAPLACPSVCSSPSLDYRLSNSLNNLALDYLQDRQFDDLNANDS
jgi:hypothetical protein